MSQEVAPSGVHVTTDSTSSLTANWTDNATSESFYKAERRAYTGTWGSGSWGSYSTLSSTIAAGSTSYADATAASGTAYQYRVTALGNQQVETITCPADVAGALDTDGVIVYDGTTSYAFWIDVDDSGSSAPSWATDADNTVEVTAIVTGDSATNVATAMAAKINGETPFAATSSVAVVTVTHADRETATTAADSGSTDFSVSVTTIGTDDSTAVVSDQAYAPPATLSSSNFYWVKLPQDTVWRYLGLVEGTAPIDKLNCYDLIGGASVTNYETTDLVWGPIEADAVPAGTV